MKLFDIIVKVLNFAAIRVDLLNDLLVHSEAFEFEMKV